MTSLPVVTVGGVARKPIKPPQMLRMVSALASAAAWLSVCIVRQCHDRQQGSWNVLDGRVCPEFCVNGAGTPSIRWTVHFGAELARRNFS